LTGIGVLERAGLIEILGRFSLVLLHAHGALQAADAEIVASDAQILHASQLHELDAFGHARHGARS
jgi:hypothetical protein